ncbi:AfsR/SARP family transcriptional regulator [Streptomyces sp. NPDC002685]|uniref:AfsR/SARP family transcriptional regulator n=1 Tax=Streptomyces sp. NPDC002685 TaxID=3154540 RepID=UPI003328B457
MEFRILGPVEVRDGQRRIALAGTKMQTVLAALLLARGRTVSDDRMSALLWGWEPPTTRNAQICTYVSRLRKQLGPDIELVRRTPGYLIRTGPARLDLLEFERLADLGRKAQARGRYGEAAGLARSALDLHRGSPLADVTDFLADAERPRLEEAWATVLEQRIEADLELGRHSALVPELTGLVQEYPVHERLRSYLMIALYRCDRQADALAVYRTGCRVLAEELGIDPGPALTQAHQAVLEGSLRYADDLRYLQLASA